MKFKDQYANIGLTFFLFLMLLYVLGFAVLMALDIMPVADLYSWIAMSIGFFGLGAWFFCQMIGPYTIIINDDGIRAKRPIGKWETYSWDAIVDSGVRRRQTGADVQYSFYFATFTILPCDHYCQRTPKQKLGKGERIFDIYFSKKAIESVKRYDQNHIWEKIMNEKSPVCRKELIQMLSKYEKGDTGH